MKNFDDFSEGFDYCREADQPVIVLIAGKKHKLFPSGYAEEVEPMSVGQGLYGKYKIEKVDGTPIDDGAIYFVLRLDTDEHARHAVFEYAQSIKWHGGNQQLADDLLKLLKTFGYQGRYEQV